MSPDNSDSEESESELQTKKRKPVKQLPKKSVEPPPPELTLSQTALSQQSRRTGFLGDYLAEVQKRYKQIDPFQRQSSNPHIELGEDDNDEVFNEHFKEMLFKSIQKEKTEQQVKSKFIKKKNSANQLKPLKFVNQRKKSTKFSASPKPSSSLRFSDKVANYSSPNLLQVPQGVQTPSTRRLTKRFTRRSSVLLSPKTPESKPKVTSPGASNRASTLLALQDLLSSDKTPLGRKGRQHKAKNLNRLIIPSHLSPTNLSNIMKSYKVTSPSVSDSSSEPDLEEFGGTIPAIRLPSKDILEEAEDDELDHIHSGAKTERAPALVNRSRHSDASLASPTAAALLSACQKREQAILRKHGISASRVRASQFNLTIDKDDVQEEGHARQESGAPYRASLRKLQKLGFLRRKPFRSPRQKPVA